MSLCKRKDSPYWWARFSLHGRRIQESTGCVDRERAQEYHDRRKAELWGQPKFRADSTTWKEAVIRYVAESGHKKNLREDKRKLLYLGEFLCPYYLEDITGDVVLKAVKGKLVMNDKGEPLPYQPNANRYIAVISCVLNSAERWKWIDRAPRVKMYPECGSRIRWITEAEADRLIGELHKTAEHLADMAAFTLSTGLRQANVSYLEWSQIDMQRRVAWIYGDQAKGKRAIPVPLNADAVEVLRRWLGKHSRYVFVWKDQPVAKCSTKAWDKAKARAGIADFRWHDLRHTWASWHVQKGTSLLRLMELGGWRSYEMVLRYAHLSPEHLREDADRIARIVPRGGMVAVK